MPNIKQVAKRHRQSLTRRARNLLTMKNYKKSIKSVEAAVAEKTLYANSQLLSLSYRAIDMAAKKRVISPQKAARLKSKLAKSTHGALEKGTGVKPASEKKAKSSAKKAATPKKTATSQKNTKPAAKKKTASKKTEK